MTSPRGLLDTSVFVARESGRTLDEALLPEDAAVSIVTIGELRLGVLTAKTSEARAHRLSTFLDAFDLDPLPIDLDVAEAWASLRIRLRETSTTMPVNDSWIAATAIAHRIPVVTQDGDFADGLGFDVIRL